MVVLVVVVIDIVIVAVVVVLVVVVVVIVTVAVVVVVDVMWYTCTFILSGSSPCPVVAHTNTTTFSLIRFI